LDQVLHGETIEVVRAGQHVATIIPPARPNGAAVVAAYAGRDPDPEFADAIEQAREFANTPAESEDPWGAA
jgi:antitoxin (DNA-binding transcriptional repressor) of toxin-antitoxin stability system